MRSAPIEISSGTVYTRILSRQVYCGSDTPEDMLHNLRPNGSKSTVPVDVERESSLFAQAEGGYAFSLQDLFRGLRRRLWVIALMTAVFTGAAVAFSLAQTPMYEASVEILVGQEQGAGSTPGSLGGDVQGLEQLTATMAKGVNSRPIAEEVIQQLNLQVTPEEFLEKHLSVRQVIQTQFIEVNYRDSSPERAQQVANAIGDVFSEQVSQVSPSASAITATVWTRAVVPDEPVSPKPVRTGMLALVLGLMLGLGLALLLEYLDNSWRSPKHVEQVSGVPTFAVIPTFKVPTGKKGGY